MSSEDSSMRTGATIAGIAFVVMLVTAIFSEFVVRQSLVIPGDAAATVSNLQRSATLFRLGIAGFLIIAIADVLVAWGLYLFLYRLTAV